MGICDLSQAVDADTSIASPEYDGFVMYLDDDAVYQRFGEQIVKHKRTVFAEYEADCVLAVGTSVVVLYGGDSGDSVV